MAKSKKQPLALGRTETIMPIVGIVTAADVGRNL